MPLAGGIAPPVVTPLRSYSNKKPSNQIDQGTYLELESESPNVNIYFSTDGSKPDPFNRVIAGREYTFRYRGPFTMKPGKRTLKAVAVHRVTKVESHVITKTFFVDDQIQGSDDSDGGMSIESYDSDEEVMRRKVKEKKKKKKSSDDEKDKKKKKSKGSDDEKDKKKKKSKGSDDEKDKKKKKDDKDDKKKDKKKSKGSDDEDKKKDKKKKGSDDEVGGRVTDNSNQKDKKKKKKKDKSSDSDDDHPRTGYAWNDYDFPPKPNDHGFAATNHSGTQINLWGAAPGMGWQVKSPGDNVFSGQIPLAGGHDTGASVNQQQMNAMANQLTQRMDQTYQMTVSDVRQAIKQLEPPPQPKAIEAPKSVEPTLMPVSPGNGDIKKQIGHVYAHLLNFAKSDADFRAEMGMHQMGKIISADFDEGDESFLVTIELAKPGVAKTPGGTKKKKPEPTPPPPKKESKGKSLRVKPEDVPDGHEAEKEVRQAKGQKADAIVLKEVEKAPELVESAYFETEEYVQEGTLKPSPAFDEAVDAQKLRTAMKGLGTDEAAIIDVMGRRSFTQRQKIVKKFKLLYGKDLIKDLESELSGNFLKICKALCLAPDDYDASELRSAMKGLGTDEDALIEIICTRTNAQIKAFKEAFTRLYPGRDVESDVVSETSSHFKRLLVSLLQAERDESQTFDREKAKADAQRLMDAGEKKFGTDESVFNEILASQSNAHLRAMFEEYEKMSSKSMEQVIESEMSGDLKTSMMTFVRCIQNKPAYFARALMKSMKGLGTNDQTLLRIIITRCEIDMVQIKDAYQKEFNQTLGQWIVDDCSGDYKKILLWLIREENLIK